MPRDMSSAMLAALQATELYPAFFVEITFATSTVRLWSGSGSTTWDSLTWLGAGSLLSLSQVEDAASTEARNITVTLSGLDTALLPECLGDIQLGLPVTVWLALKSGGSIISDPVAVWSGRVDQPEAVVRGEDFSVSLNCETRIVDLNIPVDRRYTSTDQQLDWPGDLGFQFVDAIQEMTLFWGQQANNTNNI